MKKCKDCEVELVAGENWPLSWKKHYNYSCQPCFNARRTAHRSSMVKYVQEYKLNMGCVRCGYNDYAVALQLDHIDPSTKDCSHTSGSAYRSDWSLERLKEEIDKCQVLCANCHAVKTMEVRNVE